MLKTKKLIVGALIAVSFIGGTGTIARANPNWNCGLYDGHNGYHMAYGYYYSNQRHHSWAILGGHSSGNIYAAGGHTSQANSPSVKSVSWDAGYENN